MHYKYYYSHEQLLANEENANQRYMGDDCMLSLADDNGDVCPMQALQLDASMNA